MFTWQQYQMAVGAFYELLEGTGSVEHNVMLKDRNTGQLRQVDVWISVETMGHEIHILIDAKYRKNAINVKQVEEVLSLAKAVGADKAVIVASNGWTKPAKIKANSDQMDLRLLTMEQAATKLNWHSWSIFPLTRTQQLSKLLGGPADHVYHSIIHFSRGGAPDVEIFHGYHGGVTYVTADLTGPSFTGQVPSTIGQYELMICTRSEVEWAYDELSVIAKYSLENRINPGDTFECAPRDEEPSHPIAMLATTPEQQSSYFNVLGKHYGLILLISISKSELSFAKSYGSAKLENMLKKAEVFPFSDLERTSVC